MRTILLPLICLLLFFSGSFSPVGAQSFDWTKSISGSINEDVFDVATDVAGNSFIAAHVSGTAAFGNLGSTGGGNDFAVAKFDASGICLWAARVPVPVGSVVYGAKVATDPSGNVYFGYSVPVYYNVSSPSYKFQYRLEKYSPTGTLLWSEQPALPAIPNTDPGIKVLKELLVDQSGCPVLSIFTEGGTTIVRYSPSGAIRWIVNTGFYAGETSSSGFKRIMANGPQGQFWVAGQKGGSVNFTGGNNLSTGTAFIARYDTLGQLQWSTEIGQFTQQVPGAIQSGHLILLGLADLGNGNVALSGLFVGTVKIGTANYASSQINASGNIIYDRFVLQLNPSGNADWIHKFPSPIDSFLPSQDLAADASGNITLATVFGNYITVDSNTYNSSGYYDILLLRLAAGSGTLLFSGTISGPGHDIPRAIDVQAGGVVTMVGNIWGQVQFGPDLLAAQGTDGFITKFTLPSAFYIPAGSPGASGFCAGASFPVNFYALGLYQAGNQFVLQLSDSSGSFANPTVIGTLTDTTSGTIQAMLPVQIVPGTGYRLRVISTSPATVSGDNGTDLTIWPLPQVSITSSGSTTFCQGDSIELSSSHSSGNLWSNGSTNPQLMVSEAGSYSLIYTDINGCTAQDSVMVQVMPLPSVTLVLPDSIDYVDPALVLSGGLPAGGVHSGAGVSAGMFNPATAGLGTHIITYTYTDSQGCSAQATQPIVVYLINGAAAQTTVAGFRFYPNPASGNVQVEWQQASAENTELLLTDVLGKVVYQTHNHYAAGQQKTELQIGHLPAGVYVLQLSSGQQRAQAKLVLQR